MSEKKAGGGRIFVALIVAVVLIVAIALGIVYVQNRRSSEPGNTSSKDSIQIGDSKTYSSTDTNGQLSSVEIAKKVKPSVIAVIIKTSSGETYGEGSGVVMSVDKQKGTTYIVTCAHMINTAGTTISVQTEDGKNYDAAVVGYDNRTDIGVISIRTTSMTPAEFGDSSVLQVGEPVYAIGNPGGTQFYGSMTSGIISAIDRPTSSSESGYTMECIQHDAAINPGNSGGPLINLDGDLIGINTAVYGKGWGIGFAIPINKARRVMDSLLGKASMSPIWLGLQVSDIDQRYAMEMGLKASQGVLVTGVYKNTPASEAGLEPGDVIQSINGTPINDRRDYLNLLRNQVEGAKLGIDMCRLQDGGKSVHIDIMPEAFTDDMARKLMEDRWGIEVSEVRGLAEVRRVDRNGPASFLRPGDVIEAVSGAPVESLSDLVLAFRFERLSNHVLLVIQRGRGEYYAHIRVQ